jgi:DNA-binding NarL/FixJ family response regulator
MVRIKLTEKEVEYLSVFVKKGRKTARELIRAHVLLLVNRGRTEMEINDTMGISRATVSNSEKAPFGCKSIVARAKHWMVPIS